KVLVLNMLHVMGWDAVGGKEPVQVAGAGKIEAELHRSVDKRSDDIGLEIDLQIEDEIKFPAAQLLADIEKTAEPPGAVEKNDFIDQFMTAHQHGRPRLQYPGHLHGGVGP